MKIVFLAVLTVITSALFAQENRITPLNWEEWNEEIPEQNDRYRIVWQVLSPSLSYIKEIEPSTYYILEIDLTQDLRRQAYQDKGPLLMIPKNKFIITNYTLAKPIAPKNHPVITGRRRLDYTVNRGVKNTVYKDASFYTGTCNPFTGLPF